MIFTWQVTGPIYTGDGSSVEKDHPSSINTGRTMRYDNSSDKTDYRDSSSGWMIRLLARVYTQTDYQTNYRSLPKLVLDG